MSGIWNLKWTAIIVGLSAFKIGRGPGSLGAMLLGFAVFAASVAAIELTCRAVMKRRQGNAQGSQ
jgi:hypothetical protein